MNERIFELALQASEQYDYHPEFAKKFAELIVKECLRICKDVEYFDVYDDPEKNGHIRAGAAMCREDIKEHFGITE